MGVWQVRSHELSSLLLGIYKQISVWFGRLKTSWINYKNNWVGKEWRFAHEHSRWLPRSVIMTTGTTVSMVSLSARRIWNSLSLQWGNKNIFRCSTNFIDQFWARLTNWGGDIWVVLFESWWGPSSHRGLAGILKSGHEQKKHKKSFKISRFPWYIPRA